MIDVKEAVSKAKEGINTFFEDMDLRGMELEEVEFDHDGDVWLITLGYYTPNLNPDKGIGTLIQGAKEFVRKYKIFEIRASDGEILAMRIRDDH